MEAASEVVRLLLGAARTYLESKSAERAEACVRQVLDLARKQDLPEASAALALLAEVQTARGDSEGALATWKECLARSETTGNLQGAAAAASELGALQRERGDLASAEETLRHALLITSGAVPGEERARALEELGPIERLLGRGREALECHHEALRIRQALGDVAGMARNYDRLGNICVKSGRLPEALEHYERCLALYQGLDDRAGMAIVLNNLGTTLLQKGDYDGAVERFAQAEQLFVELKDDRRRAYAIGNLGLLDTYRGDAGSAGVRLAEAVEILERVGDKGGLAIHLNNLAPVCLMSGQYEDAVRWAHRSIETRRELGQQEGLAKPWFNMAHGYLELGRLEEADMAAREVRAHAAASGSVEIESEALLLDAAIALKQGRTEDALQRAREAERRAAEGEHPRPRAEALRLQGEIHLACANVEPAREVLLRSEELFRHLPDVYHLALCRLELGELFLRIGSHEAAAHRLRHAAEVFRRLLNPKLEWRALIALAQSERPLSPPQSEQSMAQAERVAREHPELELTAETELVRGRLRGQGAGDARAFDLLERLARIAREQNDARGYEQAACEWIGRVLGCVVSRIDLEDPSMVLPLGSGAGERTDDLLALARSAAESGRPRYEPLATDGGEPKLRLLVPLHGGDGRQVLLFDALPVSPEWKPGAPLEPPRLAFVTAEIFDLGLRVHFSTQLTPVLPETGTPIAFEGIVGASQEMRRVFDILRRVAPTESSVFIYGESGTGKELVARAIHRLSSRRGAPFVAISCPSIPRELIESELFGHEKGAFTGAQVTRPGQIELANGGTLFLDEIGDMDLATQTKLLRFLQEREFLRVGGREARKVDIRLLAATSRKLDEEIRAGRFREDLFYRISVVPVVLPPLRERGGEVPHLVRAILQDLAGNEPTRLILAPEVLEALSRYRWPGNVRELRNVLEYLVAVHREGVITLADLPALIRAAARTQPRGKDGGGSRLEPGETLDARLMAVEGALLRETLERCGGNQSRAAELLGIKESTLRYKLKRYSIRRSESGRRTRPTTSDQEPMHP